MTTEPKMVQILALIDRALQDTTHLNFVPQGQFADTLLDIRILVDTPLATYLETEKTK